MSTSDTKQFTPSVAPPVKNSSSNSQSGKAFYAVAIGKKTGIYETWYNFSHSHLLLLLL